MVIPRNVQRGLVGVLLLLVAIFFYRTCSTASELQQAIETIQHVRIDLSVARESWGPVRTKVILLTQEANFSGRELRLIRHRG